MKRKLALCLVLVLTLSALTVAFASCSKPCESHVDANYDKICDVCEETLKVTPYLGFAGIYNAEYEPEKTEEIVYSKAEHKSALDDMTLERKRGVLCSFVNNTADIGEAKYAVVNTLTGDIVLILEKESTESVDGTGYNENPLVYSQGSILNSGNESFIRVVTTDNSDESRGPVYTVRIYSSLGHEIICKENLSNPESVTISHVNDELYAIDGKVFEIIEGEATYLFDQGLGSIPNIHYSTDKNYYRFSSSAVMVYDLEYKLVAYYAPQTANGMQAHLLADGNVLVQYSMDLPDNEETYDIFSSGTKLNLYTVVFNITDQTVTEYDVNYIVVSIQNTHTDGFEDTFASSSIKNVAAVYDIVNRRVITSDVKILSIDNDLSVQGALGQEIVAQSGIATPIAENRFVATDKTGREYLLNEKGDVIGEVSTASFNNNLSLFYSDGKYYDLDLNVVFDETDIKYSHFDGNDNFKIYRDTDEEGKNTYYILNGISMKQLNILEDNFSLRIYDGFLVCTYHSTNEAVYYNAEGKIIYSVDCSAEGYVNHNEYAYGNILIIEVVTYDADYNLESKYYIAD